MAAEQGEFIFSSKLVPLGGGEFKVVPVDPVRVDEKYVSTIEAAEQLKVSRWTINKLINEGELEAMRPGKWIKVRLSSVLAYRRKCAM